MLYNENHSRVTTSLLGAAAKQWTHEDTADWQHLECAVVAC